MDDRQTLPWGAPPHRTKAQLAEAMGKSPMFKVLDLALRIMDFDRRPPRVAMGQMQCRRCLKTTGVEMTLGPDAPQEDVDLFELAAAGAVMDGTASCCDAMAHTVSVSYEPMRNTSEDLALMELQRIRRSTSFSMMGMHPELLGLTDYGNLDTQVAAPRPAMAPEDRAQLVDLMKRWCGYLADRWKDQPGPEYVIALRKLEHAVATWSIDAMTDALTWCPPEPDWGRRYLADVLDGMRELGLT